MPITIFSEPKTSPQRLTRDVYFGDIRTNAGVSSDLESPGPGGRVALTEFQRRHTSFQHQGLREASGRGRSRLAGRR